MDNPKYNKIRSNLQYLLTNYFEDSFLYIEQLLQNEFQSYEEYQLDLKSRLIKCCCTNSWYQDSLSFSCDECNIYPNSCICLDCYLNGNHEDHNVRISFLSTGNCDCGDPNFFKPSGFCSKHSISDPNPHLTQLKPLEVDIYQVIFSTILLEFFNEKYINNNNFSKVCNFLKEFSELGDAVRRCLAISFDIIYKIDVIDFYFRLNSTNSQSLFSLFGSLINDKYFLTKSSTHFLLNFIHFLETSLKFTKINHQTSSIYNVFTFHWVSNSSVLFALENSVNIDQISCQVFPFLVDYFLNSNYNFQFLKQIDYFIHLEHFSDIFIQSTNRNLIQFPIIYLKKIIEIENFSYFYREINSKQNDTGFFLKWHYFSNHILSLGVNIFSSFCDYNSLFTLTFNFFNTIFEKVDLIHDLPFYLRSPLNSKVTSICSPIIPNSIFFKYFSNPSEFYNEFIKFINNNNLDLDLTCQIYSTHLVRLFSTLSSYFFKAYIRNEDNILIILQSIVFRSNPDYRLLPNFGLYQFFIGISNSKDKMLIQLFNTFGLNQINSNDFEIVFGQLFCYFLYVGSLVFDRCSINKDYLGRKLNYAKLLLYNKYYTVS